jgi:hypothetical protein
MSSFIGRKLDAKIQQPLAISNLPVATVAYQSNLTLNIARDCTIASQMSIPMAKTLSMFNVPASLPQQPPMFDGPLPNFSLQPKHDRLNQKCGCYNLDHQGNINLTSSQKISLVHLLYLNTTRFVILTLRNKPTSGSRRPNRQRNASQHAVQSSTWTLASCGPP